MSITIEQDLKEILNKLEQNQEKLADKIEQNQEKLVDKIDQYQIKISEKLEHIQISQSETKKDIQRLEDKIDGLSKRVDNVEFINRGIFIGLVVAILGGFAKLLGWIGNP